MVSALSLTFKMGQDVTGHHYIIYLIWKKFKAP